MPTFSLAILNVKYGRPIRNFYYSELPSGINAALEATCHPNVPDPQGTPSDLNIYPGTTGRAETFLPSGNAMARALYECNFARAALQINSRSKVQGSSMTAVRADLSVAGLIGVRGSGLPWRESHIGRVD